MAPLVLVIATGLGGCSERLNEVDACGVTMEEVTTAIGASATSPLIKSVFQEDGQNGAPYVTCLISFEPGLDGDALGQLLIVSISAAPLSEDYRRDWFAQEEDWTFETRSELGTDGWIGCSTDYCEAAFESNGRLWKILPPGGEKSQMTAYIDSLVTLLVRSGD
jgi:hypothetical protein